MVISATLSIHFAIKIFIIIRRYQVKLHGVINSLLLEAVEWLCGYTLRDTHTHILYVYSMVD